MSSDQAVVGWNDLGICEGNDGDICPECMKKLYPEYCEKPRVDK